MTEEFVMEDNIELEGLEEDNGIGYSENITEEDLLTADVVVQREVQQLEEEGLKDDTLWDFVGDEDDAFVN